MKKGSIWSKAFWIGVLLALVLIVGIHSISFPLEYCLKGDLSSVTGASAYSFRMEGAVNHDITDPEELQCLLDFLGDMRIQLQGGYSGSILVAPGNPVYHLIPYREEADELQELGSLAFDWQGNVYIGHFRYVIKKGDEAGFHTWLREVCGDVPIEKPDATLPGPGSVASGF